MYNFVAYFLKLIYMKKTFLLITFLAISCSLYAQTTTILFENNFDTGLSNLSINDVDGDGDRGLDVYSVPGGYPVDFSNGVVVLDGRESVNGYQYKSFDYNTFETKNPVAIPSGGSAKVTFDLFVDKASESSISTPIYLTIYNNNIDYLIVKKYSALVESGYHYDISFDIPEGLGQSYIYQIAQYDDPRVQSIFLIDNFKITHTVPLSSETFTHSNFSVYPNPVLDFINIASTNNMPLNTIIITDVNGRTIKSLYNNEYQRKIDISDLNSGIYFVTIETPEGMSTKKIIKK